MYMREKKSGNNNYLQIVEGYREKGKVRQRVIATLGRRDELLNTGKLDGLLASGAKFSEKVSILGAHNKGELTNIGTKKIGPGMVFGRLWKETGIESCLNFFLEDRRFRFDAAGAAFLTTVHRLMDPGSDRAAEKWREDYLLPGVDDRLGLHHLYRAMAWLGEELPAKEQQGRTPFAPRCVKDLIEERLFASGRDLFTNLTVAFFDTTSLYFYGEGGRTIGELGHSKDGRSHLKQMVLGVIIDSKGLPICCEIWPGNTTDVKTLIPIVDRLRRKFHVGRVIIVADRGMISNSTIKYLESQNDIHYILGARMRRQKDVSLHALSRGGRYHVVHPERKRTKDPSPLKVKEIYVGDRRYMICLNPQQARKDAADRELIIQKLKGKLSKGDKSLVVNKGFKKYLKTSGSRFEINIEKIEYEKRFDGKWALRTNTDISPAEVAKTYKQLWMVEDIFRSVKSILRSRPVFHKKDETIRGHVFCSFLALRLMKELQNRMDERGWADAEWNDVVRDADNLYESEVESSDGKRFAIRSEIKGWCGKVFQAAGISVPPTIRMLENGSTPNN